MKARYDLVVETDPVIPEDSCLVTMRFPAMKSKFDGPSDIIDLKVRPKSLKFKLTKEENVYSSSKSTEDDGQLFVCKTINNKVVCRPLSHLVTFRSDFSHLDTKEELVNPDEEVKPISVKFAATDRQNATGNTKVQDDPLDEFQPISFKPIQSNEATIQRIAYFGPQVKLDPDVQIKEEKLDIKIIPDIKPRIDATVSKQRVKECLVKAKIVSFDEICEIVGLGLVEEKNIIDTLNQFALLVQGNWAVKSKVLCEEATSTMNLYNAGRDFLIWSFSRNRLVSRPEFCKQVRLPDKDVLEMFKQLAIFRPEIKRWELKLPTDNNFIEKYPEVVQRQESFWKVRRANDLAIFI